MGFTGSVCETWRCWSSSIIDECFKKILKNLGPSQSLVALVLPMNSRVSLDTYVKLAGQWFGNKPHSALHNLGLERPLYSFLSKGSASQHEGKIAQPHQIRDALPWICTGSTCPPSLHLQSWPPSYQRRRLCSHWTSMGSSLNSWQCSHDRDKHSSLTYSWVLGYAILWVCVKSMPVWQNFLGRDPIVTCPQWTCKYISFQICF